MTRSIDKRLDGVRELYEKSLAEHGATPPGVGWRDDASHALRFEQLAQLIEPGTPATINDLGCGYGAFLDFLGERGVAVAHFRGFDISERMLGEAKRRHPSAQWILGSRLDAEADYSFASGIFNVRLAESDADWRAHVEATLDDLARCSRRGFAFNSLTTHVDYREPHLFYGDPCAFFDLCMRRYSRKVALLHDYPLYEWTLLVRK